MFKYNRFLFVLIDIAAIYIVFTSVYYLRYMSGLFSHIGYRPFNSHVAVLLAVYTAAIIILAFSLKMYEFNRISKITESITGNFVITILSVLIFSLYFYISKVDFARFVFFSGFIISPFFISFINLLLFRVFLKNRINVFYYAGTEENFILLKNLVTPNSSGYKLEIIKIEDGFDNDLKGVIPDGKPLIIDPCCNFSKNQDDLLHSYELSGGRIYSLIDIFEYLDEQLPAEIIEKYHLHLFTSYKLDSIYNKFIKRIGDIIIAFILLILSMPLILITSILIKITSRGPLFYVQKRVGLNGKEFDMFKFRTMGVNSESGRAILAQKRDPRVTFIGKILRPSRIDEIPQLINILRGDMSFIGPRPERMEIISEIIKHHPLFRKRLLVKPGLTGWAQVKYQYVSDISDMNRKLSYDLYYLKMLSFPLDVKILLYTFETVIFKRGGI